MDAEKENSNRESMSEDVKKIWDEMIDLSPEEKERIKKFEERFKGWTVHPTPKIHPPESNFIWDRGWIVENITGTFPYKRKLKGRNLEEWSREMNEEIGMEESNSFLIALRTDFPNDFIQVILLFNPEDFSPKRQVLVNGNLIKDTYFSPELPQDIAASPLFKSYEKELERIIYEYFSKSIKLWKLENGINK